MNLETADRRHLWHPYTRIADPWEEPFPVMIKGEGTRLTDSRGREYYDGISSWWCVNLGHSRRELVNAIAEQASRLQHSITGGLSHRRAIEAAWKLAGIAPDGLDRVYFASDGASAVESSLRIALQYWWNTGKPKKKNFISLEGGYHGDTLGAVGLGYLEKFHAPLKHLVNRSMQSPSPHCFHCPWGMEPETCSIKCFTPMKELVEKHAETTAAVVIEPVCQGAAGIRIYPEEYVRKLRKLCSDSNVLLILDEIAVGFGRTGKLFASDLAGVSPDILVVGKSLTGGYLPMSAAVVSDRIYEAFRNSNDMDRTFYHGHTFSGNPLAAAAACATMDVFENDQVLRRHSGGAKLLQKAFSDFGSISGVHGTAVKGWMSSLEISPSAGGAKTASEAASRAMETGLLIRPLGPVLYLWPPLVTPEGEMADMLSIFRDSLLSALS